MSQNKRKRGQVPKQAKAADPDMPISAIAPEEIVAAFDDLTSFDAPMEQTVRGYKVKVKRTKLSFEDIATRRTAVAQIVAKSLSAGSAAVPRSHLHRPESNVNRTFGGS